MSKLSRRLIWLGAFLVICVVYAWLFGVQTFCAIEARRIGQQIPIVKSIPVDLEDLSISRMHGKRLSFMGAEFEVPWDDVDEGKTRIVGNWVLIHFRSGNSIILCVSPPHGFIDNLSRDKTPDPQVFAAMYGSEVLRSDYALHKAIFEATPSQINLLTPSNRAAGLTMVLMVKGLMITTTDRAIYNIRSKDFKGFQLGNPTNRPKKMSLKLYADDIEFEINISQNNSESTAAITQAELNRIIQTVRKAAHAESVFTVRPT